ncbi:altronate oxidoreductase [Enterobacter cloacae]|uniref:Altronate oxidoreductase n=1 Tax=Enterobacter cloacae TaxID=550 RepID=A0A377LZF7_ENTCL|nr:altronate oxidoreductase [Enterobacter cloacae]
MNTLNRRDFPGALYPERIIQFGEGNFLRAFVDWQIDLLNEHTDLNAGVVVVRPIQSDFPPSLSTQDGLYTTIIRGLNEQGEAVSEARLIRSVNREISVYSQYDEFLKLAHIRRCVLSSPTPPRRGLAGTRAIVSKMRQR